MSPALALLLLACGSGSTPRLLAGAQVEAHVQAKQVAPGQPVQLTVQARLPEGWSLDLQPPTAEGLTPLLVEQEGPVPTAGGSQQTWRWELSGEAGSYEILPGAGQATAPDGQAAPVSLAPIFVDLGVQGPLAQGLSDFEAAPPPEPPPYGLIAALVGGALLVAIAVPLVLRATRKPPPAPEPDPPHVAARKAWQAVRVAGLDDHPQAVALSKVLREYLEAITGWPATMRTGPEILAWLEAERLAGPTARAHAGRILSATDRLKFAREGGGDAFFAALDDDFEVVVEATRPVTVSPDPAPGAPS